MAMDPTWRALLQRMLASESVEEQSNAKEVARRLRLAFGSPGVSSTGDLTIAGGVTFEDDIVANTFTGGSLGGAAIARFKASEDIQAHAHYGFLDVSAVTNPTAIVPLGHASFAADPTFSGLNDFDHHHGFQDSSEWSGGGTVTTMASYQANAVVTAGTITEYNGVRLLQPTKTGGTITTNAAVRIFAQTAGATNYTILSSSAALSQMAGPIFLNGAGSDTVVSAAAYLRLGSFGVIQPNAALDALQFFQFDGASWIKALNLSATVGTFIDQVRAGTVASAAEASYMATKAITTHAWYGFIDESTWTPGSAGQGHSSFNASLAISGSNNTDHHHGFQEASSYANTGTITEWTAFYSAPNVTAAGTVTSFYGLQVLNPVVSGGGTITTNAAIRILDQTAGATNYTIYSTSAALSQMAGPLSLNGTGSNTVVAGTSYLRMGSLIAIQPDATGDKTLFFNFDGSAWVKPLTLTKNRHSLIGTATEPTNGTDGIVFPDATTALSSMASNTCGLYGDDVSGTVNLHGISEAGDLTQLTGKLGYANGGGTIAQGAGSGKATGVTLSKITGLITMDGATLNAATIVSFTLTNTTIAATDTIILQHDSGGTVGAYTLSAQPGSGSAVINVRNATAGNLTESPVIRFTVFKSVSA